MTDCHVGRRGSPNICTRTLRRAPNWCYGTHRQNVPRGDAQVFHGVQLSGSCHRRQQQDTGLHVSARFSDISHPAAASLQEDC